MKIRNIKQISAFLIALLISFAIAYGLYFSYDLEKTLSKEILYEEKVFKNPLPLKNILFVLKNRENIPLIFTVSFYNESKLNVLYIPNNTECKGEKLSEIYRKKHETGILNALQEKLSFKIDNYVYSSVDDVLSLSFLPYIEYRENIDEKYLFESIEKVADNKFNGNSEYDYVYFSDKCKTDFSRLDFVRNRDKIEKILSYKEMKIEKAVLKGDWKILRNIFDTHAHYSDSAFDSDRDELLGEYLPSMGIKHILLAGCSIEESESNLELSHKYDYVYAAAGIHPELMYKAPADENLWNLLREFLQKNKDIKALGEIGLDYHYEGFNKKWQADAFRTQLEIAKDFNLPVIIHARDATQDYLDILHEYRPRGVVHCFSGSAETAREVVEKLGMYIGFTGVITYKNARKILGAAEYVPDDRILFETDCPYMTPEPNRKKSRRCDSSMIPSTAARAAELRHTDVQTLLQKACENGEELFDIH